MLFAQWSQVLVGQARVVPGFDRPAADRVTGGFDEVARADHGARRQLFRGLHCVDVGHGRTLSTAYFSPISWEIPGYCVKDISGGANNPVSVGSVAMTELRRWACNSDTASNCSTSPARNASTIWQ